MSSVSLLRRALVAVALSSLLAVSCTEIKVQKPRAFGREKEILVICNDTTWAAIEEQLRLKVEVEFQAVRREKIFELAHANQQDVDYFKEWDKIILIESLERKILLPDVVDEATLKKVAESREGLYFTKPDIWARGQSVVGLAAAAEADLPRVVALYGDRIYQGFLKILEQEEDEKMYLSGINQALADSLLRACGFSLVLPKVYQHALLDTMPAGQMLFLHQDPVRGIFIARQDNPAPLDLSAERLAAERDSLLAVHVYPGMYTLPERIDTSTVVAGGLSRIRVYGVWENRQEISGGVFVQQIIDLPDRNVRYIIDCLLFCPDGRKNKYRYIYQFDHIMDTFTLAGK